MPRVGIEKIRAIVVDDSEGIADLLDLVMQRSVDAFRDHSVSHLGDARAVGGLLSDRFARTRGLDARTRLLFVLMLGESVGLLWFSTTATATAAGVAMITFGLFTQMACGATYALVPFFDRKSLAGVAGIVGAGGNAGGAVAAGFLLKAVGSVQSCFSTLGVIVLGASACAVAVRFTLAHKASEQQLYEAAVRERESLIAPGAQPLTAA